MNTIFKYLKSKSTKIVAAVMVAAVVLPSAAGAATVAELQAQIQALLAQLAQLQGTNTAPAACAGITFTRNLRYGMTGSDVKCLQAMLNQSSDTMVATSGGGSPGNETTFFGLRTRTAVIRFQEKFRAEILTPVGLASGTGFVGVSTRAKLNAMLVATPPTQILACAPGSQTVAVGGQASLTASGGTGSYSWSAPGSTVSTNTGSTFTTSYNTAGSYTVTLTNGTTTKQCTINVSATNPGPTGPLSASAASDNPSARTIVTGQATADLLRVTFTGTGTLNSVTLTRSGISDQNTLTNVYLYNGNTRLTDGFSFNSNGTITMNNLNFPVNGSATLSVRGDVSSDTTKSGQTIAVALTSFTASGQNPQAVTIMGNTMTLANGSSLASVSFNAANTAAGGPSGTASINAGTTAYTFWSNSIQVNTRTVQLRNISFRMIGSAPADALSNIRLFVDGVDTGKTATVATIAGTNYATFDFTGSPINLTTGSHTLEVRADIQKGTNRTIQFSVQQAADITLYDPQLGVNIAVTGTGGGSIPSNAGTVTILTGSATVVVDPSFQAQTNITGGASNVTIGKFRAHAYGEDLKVNSLTITPSFPVAPTGAAGLDQVSLFFNGTQVGSSQNWTSGSLTFQLGSQMIVPAGQDSTIEVRANLRSTPGNVNYTNGSVQVTLNAGSSNAQGYGTNGTGASFNTVNFPTANVVGPTLTIQTGLLVVSANPGYANQTVAPNTTGVRIGSYVLQNQSTSESVRITSLKVDLSGTSPLTNLSALRTSETSGSGSTPVQPQASNTFSVDFTLAPGATRTIDIFADSSTQTSVNVTTALTVTYIGTSSNVSQTAGPVSGQTVTFGSGTITNPPTIVSASSTPSQYVASAGGATDSTKATFNVSGTGGNATISELKFEVSGSAANPASSIRVGNVSAPVVNGVAYLTGLNLAVPNGGGGLNVDAFISYPHTGVGGNTSGTTSTIGLSYVKYTSGGTTSTLCTTTYGPCNTTLTGNVVVSAPTMTLVGSKPTVTLGLPNGASGTSSTGLTVGTIYVADIRVTADAKGDIRINTIPLTFTGNAAGTTISPSTALNVKDANGSLITNATVGSVTGNGTSSATALITFTGGYTIPAGTTQTFRIEVYVSGLNGSNSDSVAVGVSPASSFTWTDVAGNGATAAEDGILIINYPTSTVSIRS